MDYQVLQNLIFSLKLDYTMVYSLYSHYNTNIQFLGFAYLVPDKAMPDQSVYEFPRAKNLLDSTSEFAKQVWLTI